MAKYVMEKHKRTRVGKENAAKLFKQFLKRNNVYEKYIYELMHSSKVRSLYHERLLTKDDALAFLKRVAMTSEAIDFTLRWVDTLDGHSFWSKIDSNYTEFLREFYKDYEI